MSVSYKDYYAILGVSKTATKQEITKAYKALARKYHPDLNKGDKNCEDKFKEVNEAYEVLKDEEKRSQYDSIGSDWQNDQRFSGFRQQDMGSSGHSSFFDSLFGGGGFSSRGFGGGGFEDIFGQQAESLDKKVSIEVSLEDIARGVQKQISLQDSATGKTKNLEVTIPEGISDGSAIRLKGQGLIGRNGAKGDVYLTVTYRKHTQFTIEGTTVYYTLHCTPWTAVLGGIVTIPTLYGSVQMTIAPCTTSGSKLRLQGKGLGTAGNKGAQIVTIIADAIPEETNTAIEKAWKALEKAYESK